MRSSTLRAATLLVAAVIACAGCGSNDDSSQSSARGNASAEASKDVAAPTTGASTAPKEPAADMRFNPCKLVTAADLTAALGGSFSVIETDNPQIVGSFSERNCGYTGPNDRTVQIQTEVDDQPGGTVWEASVTAATSNLAGGSSYEEVPGVGDKAFYGNSATIVTHKGVVVVTINFLGEETSSTTKPLLKSLAAKAVGRVSG